MKLKFGRYSLLLRDETTVQYLGLIPAEIW
jgi:hypothetical protein